MNAVVKFDNVLRNIKKYHFNATISLLWKKKNKKQQLEEMLVLSDRLDVSLSHHLFQYRWKLLSISSLFCIDDDLHRLQINNMDYKKIIPVKIQESRLLCEISIRIFKMTIFISNHQFIDTKLCRYINFRSYSVSIFFHHDQNFYVSISIFWKQYWSWSSLLWYQPTLHNIILFNGLVFNRLPGRRLDGPTDDTDWWLEPTAASDLRQTRTTSRTVRGRRCPSGRSRRCGRTPRKESFTSRTKERKFLPWKISRSD